MKKQIIVIGLGRFGTSLAKALSKAGHDVLALDRNEKSIQNISAQVTHVIQADATDETVLKDIDIDKFDIAVVAMGTAIESSVLSTILLKKLGVPYVIARANSELHGTILEKIGADTVVFPEREMGIRVAQVVTLTNVSDYMPVAQSYGIAKLTIPDNIAGENLENLGCGQKGKWEVAVLLIQREGEVIVTPGNKEVVKPNDILILAGENDKIEKLLTEARKNKGEDS